MDADPDTLLRRAQLLYEQRRPDDAIPILRQILTELPSEPVVHRMLALCHVATEELQLATEHAEQAVAFGPAEDASHYVHALVLVNRNRFREAMDAIDNAIRIDPEDAEYYQLKGVLHQADHQWKDALDAADAGLQCDPENVGCLNLKAESLVKLGQHADAEATLAAALAKDPDSSSTHANQGWAQLHANEPKQAMIHFREALRLDPENEHAKLGIVEAMKARHFIYRIFLRYLLWMSTLTPAVMWGIMIGGYIAYRTLYAAYDNDPDRYFWVIPILILYVAFALLSWLAMPVFNLMLQLSSFGRHALSPDQRRMSSIFGTAILAALAACGLQYFYGRQGVLEASRVAGLSIEAVVLLIPVAGLSLIADAKRRRTMWMVLTALFAVFLASRYYHEQAWQLIGTPIANENKLKAHVTQSRNLSRILMYGVLASQFLVNYLATTRRRR